MDDFKPVPPGWTVTLLIRGGGIEYDLVGWSVDEGGALAPVVAFARGQGGGVRALDRDTAWTVKWSWPPS